MRTGKVKIKRYRIRKRRWGWLMLLAVLAAGGVAWHFYQQGDLPLPLAPVPTLTPEEAAADERTLTLPGQCWYALQLGVFEQEASARAQAQAFQARGAAGFIDTREKFRVLAAAYESRASAQAVQTQLRSQHNVDVYIYELISPEVTLRITGQRAQLTTLSDTCDALYQTMQHLNQLSSALDQRTMADADIRSALQSRKDTLDALGKRLNQLFGKSPHQAVQPLESMLDELSGAIGNAILAQGETRLGAGLKYCQLLSIIRLAEYADLLAR